MGFFKVTESVDSLGGKISISFIIPFFTKDSSVLSICCSTSSVSSKFSMLSSSFSIGTSSSVSFCKLFDISIVSDDISIVSETRFSLISTFGVSISIDEISWTIFSVGDFDSSWLLEISVFSSFASICKVESSTLISDSASESGSCLVLLDGFEILIEFYKKNNLIWS